MDIQDFSRSKALNLVPSKKVQFLLSEVDKTSDPLNVKAIKKMAINRFSISNIPIEYWNLSMEKDFKGDLNLLNKYNELTSSIKDFYLNGKSICFSSQNGRGKTLTMCNVLKLASLKNYTCLYSTLESLATVITSASSEDKYLAKRELNLVDFLVIDEVDNRFFGKSDLSSDLFGKTLEVILRTRLQNKLPTLMATNSPNIKEIFSSYFKESLDSLLSNIEVFYVSGDDFRKK